MPSSPTLRYGDVHPQSRSGQIFTLVYITLATIVIANVISLPTEIYLSRMRRAAMHKVRPLPLSCVAVQLALHV